MSVIMSCFSVPGVLGWIEYLRSSSVAISIPMIGAGPQERCESLSGTRDEAGVGVGVIVVEGHEVTAGSWVGVEGLSEHRAELGLSDGGRRGARKDGLVERINNARTIDRVCDALRNGQTDSVASRRLIRRVCRIKDCHLSIDELRQARYKRWNQLVHVGLYVSLERTLSSAEHVDVGQVQQEHAELLDLQRHHSKVPLTDIVEVTSGK